MKKTLVIIAGSIIFLLAILYAAYSVLSNTPKNPIDKSAELSLPLSKKSATEYYAFGYEPGFVYSEEREACAEQYPTKKAMWGDLHIHTAVSADAYPDGTRVMPDDAYRFAKGEAIALPSQEGSELTKIKLRRPLDFASVTDHAETYGQGYICRYKGEFPGYDSEPCITYRKGGDKGLRLFMTNNALIKPARNKEVCGEDGAYCDAADGIVWQQMIDWAEEAYDRSSNCQFTSFVGYEYTRSINGQHMHRNTIFKNAIVPSRAASHQTHPMLHELLQGLETDCRQGLEACDVITIPHNSNISGGNAFNPREMEGFSLSTQLAMRSYRNAFDRLMEITQHKGTSECLNGASDILGDTDELCDVEAVRAFGKAGLALDINAVISSYRKSDSPECSDEHFSDAHNVYKGFCLSSRDFARGALLEGMRVETDDAPNPFEFGIIGSSDTHLGAAGYVEEDDWQGHIAHETGLEGRLGMASFGRFNRLVSNPGGLAGVYAVENSRDAIFQSMKRREAFATSGPRIEPRFFAGHFPEDICERKDWLKLAYENGTPMGSRLSPQNEPFQLLIEARADELSKPLEKLQLIKGWIGPEGHKHSQVIDIASAEAAGRLCGLYRDNDYNPDWPTYYYIRAVEVESERWSAKQCAGVSDTERPEECDNTMPTTIREMAWSSPIWLTPFQKAVIEVNVPGHDHQNVNFEEEANGDGSTSAR